MVDAPRVSVVLPVFNAEQFVAEAVQSILDQTFPDFELIVIDDGSTDGSPAILESLAAKDVRIIIRRQNNSGLVESLNRGCASARGQYIARMDADDISSPERLRSQVKYLDDHPETGIVGTWFQYISADGRPGPVCPLPTSPDVIRWFLMFGNCIAHPTVMVRREVITRLHYYRHDAVVEDYDLWVRASEATNLANLPEVLLRYRIVSDSVDNRDASRRQEYAAKLQRELIQRLLNVKLHGAKPTLDSLMELYSEYRCSFSLNAGDESEIALDVLRRLYLSGDWKRHFKQLPVLTFRVFSMATARKTYLICRSYVATGGHGFRTQKPAPE